MRQRGRLNVDDTRQLTTAAQFQALAHPLRQRVLRVLATEPMTNRQLAERLGVAPGRLHFHVRMLERAGLIEIAESRPKGGVVEKYYRPVANRFVGAIELPNNEGDGRELVRSALTAALDEYRAATDAFGDAPPSVMLGHEQAAVSTDRLKRIQSHLTAIQRELQEAGTDPDEEDADHRVPVVFTWLMHQTRTHKT